MWKMKNFLLLLVLGLASFAQTTTPQAATEDYSGTYSFLHEGELIEFNQQEGHIIGDVQRLGDSDSDRGVMLTHFFDKAALEGNKLTFSTKAIHSVKYDFTGMIQRGQGKTRAEEDYYRLAGTLTETINL